MGKALKHKAHPLHSLYIWGDLDQIPSGRYSRQGDGSYVKENASVLDPAALTCGAVNQTE